MKAQIDLHLHTTASDGLHSPTEVVEMTKDLGLKAIAITDHDTIDGLPEALAAGQKYGLEVIPGVEITNYWSAQNRREFHTLGYFIDLKNKKLYTTLAHYQQVREDRARKIIKALQNLGYRVTYESVKKIAGGVIGRPHPARAVLAEPQNHPLLTENFGIIPSIGEFIEAYIVPGKPAYFEKAGLEPDETIELIHQANGLAVLAHPGWNLKFGEEGLVKQFSAWGIDGLEAIHGKRTKADTLEAIRYFKPLAEIFNLLITAGSDFHAKKTNEPGNEIGLKSWQITMSYDFIGKMKEKQKTLFG